jgi:hypothetical protein
LHELAADLVVDASGCAVPILSFLDNIGTQLAVRPET